MFKLSSSGPCETRRAHWIPCENPVGKSRDLPWMFPFLLQLWNGTEETQYTSILILLIYKQNIFSSPWSVLTLIIISTQFFCLFIYPHKILETNHSRFKLSRSFIWAVSFGYPIYSLKETSSVSNCCLLVGYTITSS